VSRLSELQPGQSGLTCPTELLQSERHPLSVRHRSADQPARHTHLGAVHAADGLFKRDRQQQPPVLRSSLPELSGLCPRRSRRAAERQRLGAHRRRPQHERLLPGLSHVSELHGQEFTFHHADAELLQSARQLLSVHGHGLSHAHVARVRRAVCGRVRLLHHERRVRE
jgi:hypothetical protein